MDSGANASPSVALPVILASAATALWCYAFAKAGLASITHDEASTYFHHLRSDFFTCLYSPDCWKSANNHLLNTLLWQQTIKWLGPTELGMRLPNLAGYLLYLAGSAFMVLRLTRRLLPGLAAFALLNFNPYLIDFFALARGYGLCAGLVLSGIAFWFAWWHNRQTAHLIFCCLALVAAILANFVALNVFVAIGGATFLFMLVEDRRSLLRVSAVFGGTAVILALVLHRPIRFLRQGGEFQYGAGSLWESLESMIKNPLYGNAYLGDATVPVLSGMAYMIFAAIMVFAFLRLRNRGLAASGIFLAAAGLAFLLSVAAMVAQHHLLGSVYLVNRTAVPLMPLMSAVFAVGLLVITARSERKPRWEMPVSVLLLFTLTWNLVRAADVRYYREWWYDQNTKDVMLYVEDLGASRQKNVSMGTSWLFYPAAEFYRVTIPLQHIYPLPTNEDIRPDSGFDYYYLEDSKVELLGEAYEREKYFPWGRILMRKKPVPAETVAQ